MIAATHCNSNTISSLSTAAHAIHRFGGLLVEDEDRVEVLRFLAKASTLGWSAANTISRLCEQWFWDESIKGNLGIGIV